MRVSDLIDALERIAPFHYAETWDNVGLLLGNPTETLKPPVALTIDLDEKAVAEAIDAGAGALLVYHPPIFKPIRRLTPDTSHGRALLRAARAGLTLLSPHTALDAAPGGVTDWLCDMLAPEDAPGATFADRRAIVPLLERNARHSHKIVTFVPADHVEQVRDALASIGAGSIGLYERCSFMTSGQGTFLGGEGSNPAVGHPGHMQTVKEVRLEMVCPADALGLAREVLRQFHPYEEPAWDVYELAAKPDRSTGAGRRLTLDRPATPRELAARLKKNLGVEAVKLAAASDAPVERIGVCPGAGASLLEPAIADNCTLFVTGEMTHHEALGAVERGCSVLLAGHTNTERGFLDILALRINDALPGAKAFHCTSDAMLFRTL